MTLYSSPPAARTFPQEKPTLLVSWWCTCFACAIIITRVCGRYIRTEKLFMEDWLAFACLLPLFVRMALVHVILLYGTNNAITTGLSDDDLYRRMIGSRLVLASRIFYAATLWMLKLTISEFFKRLTFNIWTRFHERVLHGIRWFLLISFIAVIVSDLAECHPITHYWQVVPDPGGQCRQGYAELLTMGIANVITDLSLVAFLIPIILRSKMKTKKKVQLVFLFAGSLLPAGTTLYRIPNIIDRHGSQQYRSLLASIEILFATAVANALVLGSFVRDKGLKKQRWKFGSLTDSMERTVSCKGTVARLWGSDEDLVRDLGLGVDPQLRETKTVTPRPAPMAVPGNYHIRSSEWQFLQRGSMASDVDEYFVDMEESGDADGLGVGFLPRRTGLFNPATMFEESGTASPPRTAPSLTPHPRAPSTRRSETDGGSSLRGIPSYSPEIDRRPSPTVTRRGLSLLLRDVGGLLTPLAPLSPQATTSSRGAGLKLSTIYQERFSPSLLRPSPNISHNSRSHTPAHTPAQTGTHTSTQTGTQTPNAVPSRAASQNRSRNHQTSGQASPNLSQYSGSRPPSLSRPSIGLFLQDAGGLLKK